MFTGTVAHKMVRVASGQAEKSGAIIKHCNSSSACALNDALTECFLQSSINIFNIGLVQTNHKGENLCRQNIF